MPLARRRAHHRIGALGIRGGYYMRRNWLTLGACAAAALIITSGCSKAPNDSSLATNIKAAMFSDPQLKDANIDVTVTNGVTTLKGNVASGVVRTEAEKVASQNGAKIVDNEITIQVTENAPASAPVAPPAPKPEKRSRKAKQSSNATTQEAQPAPPAPVTAAQNIPPQPPPAPEASPAPAPATATALPAQAPPPAPEPKDVTIPAGTTITVRMIDSVDSSVNHTGEIFHASLDTPIIVDNNVVVPRGADVYIRLTAASKAGTMTGKSELHLELVKMDFQGRSYSLVSSTYSLSGKSRGKGTATKVGGGAVLGTIIGAIAGGGKGAAIGAAVGAAGGGVYQGASKAQQVKVPAETKLDFQLEQPASITVQPHAETANNSGGA